MTKKRIDRSVKMCFVALGILPCIDRGPIRHNIGGAEVQQAALGRALVDRGIDVCFVTLDELSEESEIEHPFTVYPAFRRDEGIPGLRFIFARTPKIWAALRNTDADIFYVRGAGYLAGIVSIFCMRHGRKMIFSAASDADFVPRETRLKYWRDRALFRYGLKHADVILCQSKNQQKALLDNFGLGSTLISSIVPRIPKPSAVKKSFILWVSNFRELKQPLHFLELARGLPDERFVMIGGPVSSEKATFDKVAACARSIPNLDFLGQMRLEETEKQFDRAKLLVNTSYSEGFPNTFLQSWVRGIPVVSYLDPDGLIERFGLGHRVETPGQLKVAVQGLAAWDEQRASRIREFCKERYYSRPINLLQAVVESVVTA